MDKRALLVGWPSAAWKIILPLIDEGKLPHLNRLIDTGVIGKVTTLQPNFAPSVWTSVATGKHAHDHRILGLSEPLPNGQGIRPVTSLSRSTKALWNILNQSGKKCQLVGWPASHPAEPLDGSVITDFFPTFVSGPKPSSWPLIGGAIHPENLVPSLAELRMHPGEISGMDLLAYVPKLQELETADDPRLRDLASVVASTVTIHAASTELLATQPWDFHAVCFSGIDSISRAFMNYRPPRPNFVSEEDFELFGGVVEAIYVFHDLLLGTLLEHVGEETTVILLSDQGFHSGDKRHDQPLDEPGAPPENKEVGVLVFHGPGVKQDTLIFGSSILDITPTLLHVYDLPVGRDMPGKVLVEAFEESELPQFIDSWDDTAGPDGRHPAGRQFDPLQVEIGNGDCELSETQEKRQAARYAKNTLRLQLADSYAAAFREGMAIPILEELWADDPADSRYGYKLMLAYIAIRRPELARDALERMMENKKKYCLSALREWKALDSRDPESLTNIERMEKAKLWKQSRTNLSGMAFLRAWVLHAEDNAQGALEALAMADEGKVYNLIGLLKLKADCFYSLKQWSEAEAEYRRILELQEDNADAYLGLAKTYFDQEKYQEAAEHASSSIGLRYLNPMAHYVYGGSVFRCGHPQRAADAMKVVVAQYPQMIGAYLRLHALYSGPLRDSEQAEYYQTKMTIAVKKGDLLNKRRNEGL